MMQILLHFSGGFEPHIVMAHTKQKNSLEPMGIGWFAPFHDASAYVAEAVKQTLDTLARFLDDEPLFPPLPLLTLSFCDT